ncbi:MAG TPA: class I SAM-dependent methyltransferase [Verrucomicrobiae bacterium]|jgi:ubiquinone/menaquinone biosynthesis C-methylase UbiE|nr:class I SAM-dependent methyltransferase [Verrucomicrobiae bacterium]
MDSSHPSREMPVIDRLSNPSRSLWKSLDRWVYKDEEEYLENPALPMEERVALVRGLNGVNRRSGYFRIFLSELEALIMELPPEKRSPSRPLKILDIGVGGGGLLERIYAWSIKKEVPVQLFGIDVDKDFLDKTRDYLAEKQVPATLILGSGQDLKPLEDRSMDIVVSSYVVHHVRAFEKLRAFFDEILRVSRLGWMIVDMERRFWGPPFALFGGYLFGGSTPLVWDGVKSMRRAYTSEEINVLLNQVQKASAYQGMHCQPHAFFPYWFVKGLRTPSILDKKFELEPGKSASAA